MARETQQAGVHDRIRSRHVGRFAHGILDENGVIISLASKRFVLCTRVVRLEPFVRLVRRIPNRTDVRALQGLRRAPK